MVRRVILSKPAGKFTFKDMLVTLDQPQRAWDPAIHLPGEHRGQLKLLIGCMMLFTLLLKLYPSGGRKITVVYAGAAPGQNIALLSDMYQDIDFHLYDPAPFAIKETERLHIYRELFTDQIAQQWARRSGGEEIVLISDIRSCTGFTKKDFEDDVHNNMMLQKKWVEIITPSAYFLKFRIPYTVIERGENYTYLDGKLFYQAYPGSDSMEMRLFGQRADIHKPLIDYQSVALERILFYHNSRVRPNKMGFLNLFTDDNTKYEGEIFHRDYDSTYFLFVLAHYLGFSTSPNFGPRVLKVASHLVEQLTSRRKRS